MPFQIGNKFGELNKGKKFPYKPRLGMKGKKLRLGKYHTEESKQKMREASLRNGNKPPSRKGIKFTDEQIRKMKINPNKGRFIKGHPTSKEIKEKIRKTLKGKMLGEKAWNWKGGLSSENQKIRSSSEYRLWRKAVFQRDNWTCQKLGIRGGYLIAHHINNFADFTELRLAIDNGITLSEKAHRDFHQIYGKYNNTREQLIEFLNIQL